jgi:hypothetical protein
MMSVKSDPLGGRSPFLEPAAGLPGRSLCVVQSHVDGDLLSQQCEVPREVVARGRGQRFLTVLIPNRGWTS